MVSAVASSTAATAGTAAKTTASAAQAQQTQFLQLLVTQLQNQDPLNPMDNAAITTQMAQLSTVQGIGQLNSTMTAFSQSQAFQSVSMIGHNILAPGNAINLSGGAGVAGVTLPSAASTVTVTVKDANGAVVNTLNLGAQPQGVVPFTWNGKASNGTQAPDGAYTFSVTAAAGGTTLAPVGLSEGLVQSVLMDSTGPALAVQGMGQIALSSVAQIL